MTARKSEPAPVVEETITPAVQPEQLAAMHHTLRTAEGRLVLRLDAARSRLRSTAPDLAGELEAARVHRRSYPGNESAALTSWADRALTAVTDLADALGDACLVRDEALALVALAQAQLATMDDPPSNILQLEHRDSMRAALVPVKVSLSTVVALLDRGAPLLSLARVCAGRTAQAALTAAREFYVEHMGRRLTVFRLAIENARAAREDEQLAVILQAMERQLEASLPVPSVEWPKSGDPFAAPILKD